MGNKKIKILVIGTGSVAIRHIRNIYNLYPNMNELYLFSKNKRGLWFKNYHNLKRLKVIKSLKIKKNFFTHLIIASNTSTHAEYIKKFHNSFKRIYCEKPIGFDNNFKFLKKLSNNINQNNKIYIGFQWRFNPTVRYIKEYIKKNKSKIYQIDINIGQNIKDWRKNSNYKKFNYSGNLKFSGVHWELCHELDILNFVLNSKFDIISKFNFSKKKKFRIIDNANSLISFDKENIVCRLSQNMISPFLKHTVYIYTTQEQIYFDLIKNKCLIKNKLKQKKILIEKNFKRNDMFKRCIQAFLKNNQKKYLNNAKLKDGVVVTEQILQMENKI